MTDFKFNPSPTPKSLWRKIFSRSVYLVLGGFIIGVASESVYNRMKSTQNCVPMATVVLDISPYPDISMEEIEELGDVEYELGYFLNER